MSQSEDTGQAGPSSLVSTGKLRPIKCKAWSGPAPCTGWSLSSAPAAALCSQICWSPERRERVSCGEMLSQGRPAPAQDGGGGSQQYRGGEASPMHMLRQFPWQLSPEQLRKTPDPPSQLVPASTVPGAVTPTVKTPPSCPDPLISDRKSLHPTWSPKKAECRRLRSPKSPMERPRQDSRHPALGRRDRRGWGEGRYCACAQTGRVWGDVTLLRETPKVKYKGTRPHRQNNRAHF